ncbi:MAG: DUF1648 domain-containing protein [Lachnospiraceae bacterium]|nr:DUF1648 domain-containing protein [Lachnospiraceae bacterium]
MFHFIKKIFHKDNRKLWILFAISVLIAGASLPFLPDQIPIHFDAYGNVDSYGTKSFIFLAPGLLILIIFFVELFRSIDPKKDNYSLFQKHYYSFCFMVGLVLFFIELYTLWYCYLPDRTVNASIFIPALIGILFSYIGNIMPKFKHNYFIGIRTPQTLANETVWYMTHRFGGKLWFIGGILMMLTSFLPIPIKLWLFFVLTFFLVVLPVFYSLYAYKKVTDPNTKQSKK